VPRLFQDGPEIPADLVRIACSVGQQIVKIEVGFAREVAGNGIPVAGDLALVGLQDARRR